MVYGQWLYHDDHVYWYFPLRVALVSTTPCFNLPIEVKGQPGIDLLLEGRPLAQREYQLKHALISKAPDYSGRNCSPLPGNCAATTLGHTHCARPGGIRRVECPLLRSQAPFVL